MLAGLAEFVWGSHGGWGFSGLTRGFVWLAGVWGFLGACVGFARALVLCRVLDGFGFAELVELTQG